MSWIGLKILTWRGVFPVPHILGKLGFHGFNVSKKMAGLGMESLGFSSNHPLGGGFKYFWCSRLLGGNDPIWLIFFQRGWNHQLDPPFQKVADLSPKNIFGNKAATDGTYGSKCYSFPGFGGLIQGQIYNPVSVDKELVLCFSPWGFLFIVAMVGRGSIPRFDPIY